MVSTCQCSGVTDSLTFLLPEFQVVGLDGGVLYNNLRKGKLEKGPLWDGVADYLVIEPRVYEKFLSVGFLDCIPHAVRLGLPTLWFSRYHPDLVFLRKSNGLNLLGLLGAYHSRLVFAAYEKGYDCEQTVGLFNEYVFSQLGYLISSPEEKDQLISTFKEHGISIDRYLPAWSRYGSFMHSVNHARIQPLFDLSKEVVKLMGVSSLLDDHPEIECPLVDVASYGQVWPVYPEIALRFGFEGSYRFKPADSFQTMGLDAFVSGSFKLYDSFLDSNEGESLVVSNRSRADVVLEGML